MSEIKSPDSTGDTRLLSLSAVIKSENRLAEALAGQNKHFLISFECVNASFFASMKLN